jgi:hypothetical protein
MTGLLTSDIWIGTLPFLFLLVPALVALVGDKGLALCD